MPELPEVEIICRNLNSVIKNKIVKDVKIRNINLREKIIEKDLLEVVGKKILNVKRRGKYIIIFFDKIQLVIHLGMSGTLNCVDKKDDVKKHSHVDIIMKDNSIIRYNDPRRFGIFIKSNDYKSLKYIKNCGVEPLEIENLAEFLYLKSRDSKIAIKTFLMRNDIVVGIGNIYANESLFLSGISPFRMSKSLSLHDFEFLGENIINILKRSIELGGTTLKDHKNGLNEKGSFQNELHIYGKSKCEKCKNEIEKSFLSQRSTFYCNKCQS